MEAYVVQQELSSLERPIYNTGLSATYPKTVLIPDTSQLLEFGRKDILYRSREYSLISSDVLQKGNKAKELQEYRWGLLTKEGVAGTPDIHYSQDKDNMWGLEVPPSVGSYYKLVEGDEVGVVVDHRKKLVLISSVNGVQDPEIIKSWKPDLRDYQSDYPKKPLPIEKYGDFDLRVITLLAPIGLGSSYWIIAPGGAGKTWILVKILDACLKLTKEIDNLYIIMGYIGDRPEDASQYIQVFEENIGTSGEFHQASWDTKPDSQVDVTRFTMNRARRLSATGKHVVVLFDSISRTVAAHTASSYVDKDSGMISGGIYRHSLTAMIAMLFGTHGSFGEDRSLTIIGTVLSSSDTKKTSESAVDQETSDSSTTGMCRLVKIATLDRPWVSVNEAETFTRFPDKRDFRSPEQIKEMNDVKNIMRGGRGASNSYEAHSNLLNYVKKNPFPKY